VHRFLLAALPLLLAATASAAPQQRGEWQPPIALFTASGDEAVFTPSIRIDGSGTATALWASGLAGSPSTGIEVQRPSNGSWSTPRAIPGGASARLAVNARGDAVSVWVDGFGQGARLWAAFRPANGRWQAPRAISRAGQQALVPRVGLDARGRALVVWESFHDPFTASDPVLDFATRSRSGPWSAPRTLCACSVDLYFDLAVAPSGHALLVWAQRCCGTVGENVVDRSPAGRWGRPHLLSPTFAGSEGTMAALNARGTAVVTWPGNSSDGLNVAVRPVNGGWGRPQSVGGDPWAGAALGLAPTGETVVAWATQCCLYAAARRPGAASFGQAQTLALGPLPAESLEPAAAMDARGDAVAVWMSAEAGRVTVRAAQRPAGGAFGASSIVGDVGADCYKHGCCFAEPALAAKPNGAAVAIWLARPDPSKGFCTRVEAAAFTR
jgi:hypothetical protein